MAFVTEVNATDGSVETIGKVGSSLYGVCDSLANVVSKTASVAGLDKLVNGLTIHILFVNGNSTQHPTLTIASASSNAIPIYLHGTQPPGEGDRESWYPNSVLSLTYIYNEGSNPQERWMLNDWQSDTTYQNASSNTAGLMSATDKTNLDHINTTRTTSLKFESKSTSAWAADSTYVNYGFKASIECLGVTANHFAEVCFKPDDVLTYAPASVCVTGQDVIYVWTMVNPGQPLTDITVLAILPDRT